MSRMADIFPFIVLGTLVVSFSIYSHYRDKKLEEICRKYYRGETIPEKYIEECERRRYRYG